MSSTGLADTHSLPYRINLDEPRYDQNTYVGRAKHFFITTNPLNLFCTSETLRKSKELVQQYREGAEPKGLTEDDIWRAKNIYDSAFHPDTKEKMFILGRMSAQVPMNMTITGAMITFYKTPAAVIFWQWTNQTFNAIVNYTNRSGPHPVTVNQLGVSYIAATGGAVGTGLFLNRMVKHMSPLIGRFVPFACVAAGNCINIPCMRSKELVEGIPVYDVDGNLIGDSRRAARSAIAQVVVSRILMAVPGMTIPPLIMNRLDKGAFMKKYPWMSAPMQIMMIGFILVFMTPGCCALFPQKSSMSVSHLEHDLQDKIKTLGTSIDRVYFNKGL